jgi:hypothetical protein
MAAAAKTPKAPKIVVPKTLGACADRLYKLKDEMSALTKKVEALDAERKAIQEHVIETLPKSQATGVSGKLANVKVVTKDVPQVEDWEAFYGYVRKTKRTDLMQRRLAEGAIAELMDDGVRIPGVKTFKAVKISLTKV